MVKCGSLFLLMHAAPTSRYCIKLIYLVAVAFSEILRKGRNFYKLLFFNIHNLILEKPNPDNFFSQPTQCLHEDDIRSISNTI